MENIYFGIIILILAVVLFWDVDIKKKGQWNNDALSLEQSKCLLGFYATLVIFHHLVQKIGIEHAGPIGILENLGVCFVGGFFLFSGYGLYTSMKKKPGYLQTFFKRRFPTILIPFYICSIVFFLYMIIMGARFSLRDAIFSLVGIYLLNGHMWYIVEIALFYLIFWICFRLFKKERWAITAITVSIIIVMIISLLLGHGNWWFQGEWWYNSSLLFAVGIMIATKKDYIDAFVKRHFGIVASALTVGVILFYRLTVVALETRSYWSENGSYKGYVDKLICLSVQLPMVICFTLLVLVISLKIKCRNKMLIFLGKVSLELYLIHNLFLMMFSKDSLLAIVNIEVYVTVVIVCSIIAAWLFHWLNWGIMKRIKRSS